MNSIITESEWIGKTLQEATEKATSNGLKTRIVEENGTPYMVTFDFKSDRINLRIMNNMVTGVYGG